MTTKDCAGFERLLTTVADDLSGAVITALPSKDRTALAVHVRGCETCLAAIDHHQAGALGNTDIAESIQDAVMALRHALPSNAGDSTPSSVHP